MYIQRYRIIGLTPLLMHKMIDRDLEKSTKAKGATKELTEEERIAEARAIAERHTHRLPSGQLCLPCEGFRLALFAGSVGYKTGKPLKSVLSIFKSSVSICEPYVGLIYPDTGKPIMDFDSVDTRSGINNNTRPPSRIIVHRPQIDYWSCLLDFELDEEFIPDPAFLMKFFLRAGKISGAGSYRPQHSGSFGKFGVELINESTNAKIA